MKSGRSSSRVLALVLGAAALSACSDQLLTTPEVNETDLSRASSNRVAAPALLQTAKLYRFEDLSEVPGASASMLRSNSGLRVRIHTSDLPPGDAVTLWWVIFNFPENCQHPVDALMQCSQPDLFDPEVAVSVLYAAGNVIRKSGAVTFAASLDVGDVGGCHPPFGDLGLCGQGLVHPEGAEVHFMVRTHGRALRGIIRDQIRTFAGGCTPETSFGVGTGPNECEDLQFAILLAP